MYAVEFLPAAARALAKLDPAVRRRIGRRVDGLATDPRAGAVKLRGADNVWRARVGDYRILYVIGISGSSWSWCESRTGVRRIARPPREDRLSVDQPLRGLVSQVLRAPASSIQAAIVRVVYCALTAR